jgi:hypothetical protein
VEKKTLEFGFELRRLCFEVKRPESVVVLDDLSAVRDIAQQTVNGVEVEVADVYNRSQRVDI